VARCCFERKQTVDIGQIAFEIILEQGLAVVFLGFEIVIERPFGTPAAFSNSFRPTLAKPFPAKMPRPVSSMCWRVLS
jgi:hypothetical protein